MQKLECSTISQLIIIVIIILRAKAERIFLVWIVSKSDLNSRYIFENRSRHFISVKYKKKVYNIKEYYLL